jgi:hypothetical protein
METFAAEYPPLYCGLVQRCCAPDQAVRLFSHGEPTWDAASCQSGRQRQLTRYGEVLRMRLAPITYDAQRAQRCLARLPGLSCAELVRWRTGTLDPALDCDTVFQVQGNQREGGRCVQPYDCAPGLACLSPAHDSPGVCRPTAQVPGACPTCPAGAFCDTESKGMCLMGAPDGAACQIDHRCASRICWGADRRENRDGICGVPAGTCANQP